MGVEPTGCPRGHKKRKGHDNELSASYRKHNPLSLRTVLLERLKRHQVNHASAKVSHVQHQAPPLHTADMDSPEEARWHWKGYSATSQAEPDVLVLVGC